MPSGYSDVTRGIVFRWTISGAFGWLIAFGLLGNIGDVLIDYTLFYQNSILVFAIGAAAISVMQGIALKGYIRSTITWSVLTFVSFIVIIPTTYVLIIAGLFLNYYFGAAGYVFGIILAGSILGLMLGAGQSILLSRQGLKVLPWIFSNVVGCTAGLIIGLYAGFPNVHETTIHPVLGMAIAGLVLGTLHGIITGRTIRKLFSQAPESGSYRSDMRQIPLISRKGFAIRLGITVACIMGLAIVMEGIKPGRFIDLHMESSGFLGELAGPYNALYCAAVSPDASLLAVGVMAPNGGKIELKDLKDGSLKATWKDCNVRQLVFSQDNRFLAAWIHGEQAKVSIIELEGGSILHELPIPKSVMWYVPGIAFSPDGSLLAAGSEKAVQLRCVLDGSLVREINACGLVSFSPDGKMIAARAGGKRGDLTLWRISDGKPVRAFKENSYGAGYSVFSPDGTMLATSAIGNFVKLWRVSDCALLKTIKHKDDVRVVSFSPDGKLLAVGSTEGGITIWEMPSGIKKHHFYAHNKMIVSLGFMAGPPLSLWSAGNEGRVFVWRVDE